MAKKKKKKQKNKVKPSFLNVMNRGAGGEISEVKVKYGQAINDFGEPIIEFLTSTAGNDEIYLMNLYREALAFVHIIWNGAIDNDMPKTLEELSKEDRYSRTFNLNSLIPAMFERFEIMFPTFRDPAEKAEQLVTKHLGEHNFNIYKYLGERFSELSEEAARLMSDGDDICDEEEVSVDYFEKRINENPDDFMLILDYALYLADLSQFNEALENLKNGYAMISGDNKDFWEKEYTLDIINCLKELKLELSNFSWRKKPTIVPRDEIVSRLYHHLASHDLHAEFDETITTVLGDGFIGPEDDIMSIITSAGKFRVYEDENGELILTLS